MCRLFGVLSANPVSALDPLLNSPYSLFIQSSFDKKRKQGDGWGVGGFRASHPWVQKSPRPIYRDKARVQQAARATGNVLLGHIRWASNPLKLPRHELIGMPHTQPFHHGRWLFVHNGTLYIPREVKAALGSLAKYVKGKNDSEVLFYWLLKHIRGVSGAAGAIRRSLQGLDTIWKRCKGKFTRCIPIRITGLTG